MTRNSAVNGRNNGTSPVTHFGKQVRKERLARKWTVHDLARESGVSTATISRVERGLAWPTERVAHAMDATFPHRDGWFMEYRKDSQEFAPPGYRVLADYENTATRIVAWCPGVLHGLIQTADYARVLFASDPAASEKAIETRVAGRLERQRRVIHRDRPPSAWFLVDVLALYREVGSPRITASQLGYVIELASLPDVTVQVVPATGHLGTISELIVMDSAAYAEHLGGGETYTDVETVTALGRVAAQLQAESYRQSESLAMIERVKEIWERGESPLTAGERADRA